MANEVYRRYRQRKAEGAANTDLSAGNVTAYLVATAGVATPYTYDQDDEFLSAIDASARIAQSAGFLASKTFTNGLFDADDLTAANGTEFASVSTDWDAIVIVLQAGGTPAPASDRIVDYKDTGFTPPPANGSDVEVNFPSGIIQF